MSRAQSLPQSSTNTSTPNSCCMRDTIGWLCCGSAVSTSTNFQGTCFRGVTETDERCARKYSGSPDRGQVDSASCHGPAVGIGWATRRRPGARRESTWLSLLEPHEAAQLILEGEADAAAASGIAFRTLPIPDRGVPASRESVAELAGEIVDALEAGTSVAVHCRQGIGRSGLILGGILAAGKDPVTALETVEEARGARVPETEEQRQWLTDFAARLALTKAAQQATAADGRSALNE